MRFPFAPTDHFGWAGQWGLYSGLSLDLSGKRWFWAEFFTPPKIQNGVNGHEPAFKGKGSSLRLTLISFFASKQIWLDR